MEGAIVLSKRTTNDMEERIAELVRCFFFLSSQFKGGGPYTVGFTLCCPIALRVFLLCLKVLFHTLLGSPYAVLWHSVSFFSV